MNTIDGDDCLAWTNRSRTRAAPTPTIASTNSDAAIEKKGTSASPATARASNVLPVPGGPASSTPWGMRPPRRPYFSGWRRKSTTSLNSAFASSMPATSAKVTRSPLGAYRRARDRPKLLSAFCMPPARRSNRNSRPRNSRVGPNPTSTVCHQGAPVESGLAFTTTPLVSSSCESETVSANAGTSVSNPVDFSPPYDVGFSNVPWIAVPTDVISATFPDRTWVRKNGL